MAETNQTFEAFFSGWLINQEHHLHDLKQFIIESGDENHNEERCNNLISASIAHYKHYFQAKTRLVRQNVFLVLAPTWVSSFERAHLWIGGFRPRLAFRIAIDTVLDLTADQTQMINRATEEIKEEENQIADEFDKVQETMMLVEMAGRQRERARNGTAERNMETAVETLRVSIEGLVECADFLRGKSGGVIMEILRPNQSVRFLAAAAQLQINLRRLGLLRDQRRLLSR